MTKVTMRNKLTKTTKKVNSSDVEELLNKDWVKVIVEKRFKTIKVDGKDMKVSDDIVTYEGLKTKEEKTIEQLKKELAAAKKK